MNDPTIVERRTTRLAAAFACAVFAAAVAPAVAQESAPASRAASRPRDFAALKRDAARKLAELRGPDDDPAFPGGSLGVAFDDGASFGVAVGWNDRERRTPLLPEARLHAGSVGKTFVAAVALGLVGEGRLGLDDPVRKHLGAEPWYAGLPNGATLTVRSLMNHTSGLVRYEFLPEFDAAVAAAPDRVWKPEEQIRLVCGKEPPFAVGAGWEYSDTNYLALGLVVEQVAGAPLFDEIDRRFLRPLGLAGVVPARGRKLPGLAQGYPGRFALFGSGGTVLDAEGRFPFDPSFEWAGGGFIATPESLARWGAAAWSGRGCPAALLPQALDGVPARGLGRGARYGLGVILRATAAGPARGHAGFFPGYLTELYEYPERGATLCLMLNTSDPRQGVRPAALIDELARLF
jgi:D-alanyl-D-alanine carboxypeptidase